MMDIFDIPTHQLQIPCPTLTGQYIVNGTMSGMVEETGVNACGTLQGGKMMNLIKRSNLTMNCLILLHHLSATFGSLWWLIIAWLVVSVGMPWTSLLQ